MCFVQFDFISDAIFQDGLSCIKFDRLIRTHHVVVAHH